MSTLPDLSQPITLGPDVPDWIGEYANALRDLFNLQRYKISFQSAANPHGLDCGGAAATNVRYLHAEIELRPPLADTPRMRIVVAHEMLEVLVAPLGVTLIPYFDGLGEDGAAQAREHYLDAKEPLVQTLSRVLAAFMAPDPKGGTTSTAAPGADDPGADKVT